MIEYLTQNGAAYSGTNQNMVSDYSGASTAHFLKKAAAGEILKLEQLRLALQAASFTHSGYGGTTSLTNGVEVGIYHQVGGVWTLKKRLVPQGIIHLNILAGFTDVRILQFTTADNYRMVSAAIDVSDQVIYGDLGEAVGVKLNDSFAHLQSHRATIRYQVASESNKRTEDLFLE